MRRISTIGVYGFSGETFLRALRDAEVEMVVDVRRRRGVRGREYAWANAVRLQDALSESGVEYRHRLDLAPPIELLRLQHGEDDKAGVPRRARTGLADAYRERYASEVLDRADLDSLIADLPDTGLAALMCVEREPTVCHRSLIAERLRNTYGVAVSHIQP